jgi:putative oxidoreductase
MKINLTRMVDTLWTLGMLRLVLGGVFIYAGAVKVGAPQALAASIATFQILHAALINLLAITLPIFELTVGALLVVGVWLRAASLGTLVMTSVFTFALVSALARGLAVDCGCFGNEAGAAQTLKYISLGRDSLLVAASAILFWKTIHRRHL